MSRIGLGGIRKEIDEAKSMVADAKLEDSIREELPSREALMNRAINSIC